MKYKKTKVYIMEYLVGSDIETVTEKLNSLPSEVLNNIFKGYTLDINDTSLKERQTDKEKYQARYELDKIQRDIDNKGKNYKYKPFFSLFSVNNKDVMLIVSTLSDDERALLYKKYGSNLKNTKYNENLTENERRIITQNIIRTIRNRLELYQTGDYLVLGIEDLYPKVPLKILKEKIKSLSKSYNRSIYSRFGYNLTQKVLIHKDKKDCVISKVSKEALDKALSGYERPRRNYKSFIEMLSDVRLPNEKDEDLLLRAKSCFIFLTNYQRDLIYKKFNGDLKNVKNVKTLTKKENIKIVYIIKKLKRHMKRLNRGEVQCKPLVRRFDELTTLGDILLEIEYLTEDEKNLLKLKYGKDYLGTTDRELFNEEFNDSIRLIIEKMRKRLNRKKLRKYKITLFTYKRILELSKSEEYKNLKSVIGINPALAVLAKKYYGDEYKTELISSITGVDPLYIIDLTKAYLFLEREHNRKLTEEETKLLKFKIGE